MLRRLIQTRDDHYLTLLRVVLGLVFFAHGSQKVLGWFGGAGYAQTMGMFEHHLGLPTALAFLAIMAEFLGGLGLIAGLLSRVAAFGIAVNMVVAILMVHASNGLFMNWANNQKGEGFEYHLLVIAMAVLLMARGAGAWSLDRALDRAMESRPAHVRMTPQPSH